MSIRLVQLQMTLEGGPKRSVALVDEPHLRLLEDFGTIYELACTALLAGVKIDDLVHSKRGPVVLEYDDVYDGRSNWRLLSPVDHPRDPAHCHVTGTGLTHLGSAKNRDTMHERSASETDSMKMFRWGVEGGKPAGGQVGIAPEWFYKGDGSALRAHNQPLDIPSFGEDGGEEAEIAGIYIIDPAGHPVRIGMAQGNEFSDHIFEKKNYLNLAGSKLRTCSIGPELVIDPDFTRIPGDVAIIRGGSVLWSKPIATGESEMCHSLANIEHHHFKFDNHRRSGDIHVHFYGACALSFGEGIRMQNGDTMEIHFEGFGRPLRNPLRIAGTTQKPITVRPIA